MTNDVVKLRQVLHRNPELSGSEAETARRIVRFFKPLKPTEMIEGLGGHGLAVVFSGQEVGPTVLLRCELDALPIQEINPFSDRSRVEGVGHQCGHDGHMAIVAAVGVALARQRPKRGRVVLLFQPAEEIGKGAAEVVKDDRFSMIAPDYAFALHNLPGYPLGQVLICDGAFSAASRGMAITLTGKTAHAAQPETGRSPARALCKIIQQFSSLPQDIDAAHEMAFVTVVGANLGEKAFGTAPGRAEVWATLRSETDDMMACLIAQAEAVVADSAKADGLEYRIDYDDIFGATVNASAAANIVRRCAGEVIQEIEQPFRWSEDFGRITATCKGAMFGLGAGEDTPDLHDPHYRFPDELIAIGADLFLRIIRQCLLEPSASW
ncbi:amidohydrolase [Sedimenticola sp.]|uniref:amidohydrolase n=1 Tax=Sedimenticola sp. TaxID=1940285 RepID=UPI003D0FEAA6